MTPKKLTFLLRLASTLGLWGVIVASVLANNDAGFFLIILFMALVALNEYFHMVKEQGAPVFTLTGTLCAAVYLTGSFLYLRTHGPEHSLDLEMGVLVGFLFVIFARQMFRAVADREPLEAIGYTVFGLLYIPWLFNFITKIIYLLPRTEDGGLSGQYYVIFLMVVTKFSDMGAYVFGTLFGRHPFAPHISPKKTWEGFAGALLSSTLGGFWLYALMPARLSALRFDDVIILSLLLGTAAVIGDLAESIIKRSAHAKDSSHIFPGIGGTLDLIDSMLFTAPLMYFYLRLVIGVFIERRRLQLKTDAFIDGWRSGVPGANQPLHLATERRLDDRFLRGISYRQRQGNAVFSHRLRLAGIVKRRLHRKILSNAHRAVFRGWWRGNLRAQSQTGPAHDAHIDCIGRIRNNQLLAAQIHAAQGDGDGLLRSRR